MTTLHGFKSFFSPVSPEDNYSPLVLAGSRLHQTSIRRIALLAPMSLKVKLLAFILMTGCNNNRSVLARVFRRTERHFMISWYIRTHPKYATTKVPQFLNLSCILLHHCKLKTLHIFQRMLLKRGMGNGEWGMGNGEWGMGNWKWEMGNGKLKMGNWFFSH